MTERSGLPTSIKIALAVAAFVLLLGGNYLILEAVCGRSTGLTAC